MTKVLQTLCRLSKTPGGARSLSCLDSIKKGDRSQYAVKARDAINRRLYKGFVIVKTAIYRVFVIYSFLPYPNCIAIALLSRLN
ncbi:hypothetical protein H6G81_08535 [Scytonema hofmannii FACHB-248]|uniref:Uncharacterized protein n=1 Tax=Scytonema hofmannii FACHB-248 TaxID=1842502 RepID=A0ABR8GMW1_9CYAN|nr:MULTISPECIES: hypothetical protein [Nostocales]MBD2604576.1 hypothetical protein [Scytonema hofmannii FACHB-248]